jgi:hypothetical protein
VSGASSDAVLSKGAIAGVLVASGLAILGLLLALLWLYLRRWRVAPEEKGKEKEAVEPATGRPAQDYGMHHWFDRFNMQRDPRHNRDYGRRR